MFKFLARFFSFSRIRKQAAASKTEPHDSRRLVAQRLFFVTLAVFILIILRLTWLIAANEVNGVNLTKAAANNYTYTYTVYPKRGTIFDRSGDEIAMDASNYTLYVTLDKRFTDTSGKKLYAQASDFPKLATFINKEIPELSTDYIMTQLTRKGAVQVYFGTEGKGIQLEQRDKMLADAKKEGLIGIGFDSNLTRKYPNGAYATYFIGTAHLIESKNGDTGLVGTNNGGVEDGMNDILQGQPSTRTVEKDQLGNPIYGAILSQTPAKDGADVYTTLDGPLQTGMESMLNTLTEAIKPDQMAAVLMDAKSGDILASSQRPIYNPSDMSGIDQKNFTWADLSYGLNYEPGSTMKSFTVAAAMDSGNWTPNETYDRTSIEFDDGKTKIQDWDVNENDILRGMTMTYAQGFAWSSNVGMGKLEQHMGYDIWGNYLQRFGFGKPTRTGLENGSNEGYGNLPKDSDEVSKVMSAFGQGISVTMLQMMRAWTSFANNGTMLEPHFISMIVNNNTQQVLPVKREVIGKPISAETAKGITQLMETVDTDNTYGTANGAVFKDAEPGPLFVINGQPAAVKTGTAQIAVDGKYSEDTTINSIVVLYPPENPDFIFYLTSKNLSNNYSLPTVATQVNTLLTLAETRKSQLTRTAFDLPEGKVKLDDYYGKSTAASLDKLRQNTLQPVAIGDGGKVNDQSIDAGEKVDPNTKILLYTNGKHTMPDMYGWSKSDVKQLAKWYNMKVTFKGQTGKGKEKAGVVTDQSIQQLTVVKKDAKITVTLGNIN
ncbi:MAG: penicillin-binding protein [Streptococcaceae bacterium]|jgi:penicillin-binding protein 2X|nr:penicillin-binding protein [Streptococcaceae bacterium]